MANDSVVLASPYARAFAELTALGYHAIPLMPPGAAYGGAGKAPGEYRSGRWCGLREWQRFRDTPPNGFQTQIWSRWDATNIGLVLGSAIGREHHLIAVDIDATDYDTFVTIASALPNSPMVKRGSKGETRFYRAPKEIRTASYDDTRTVRTRIADLLTGFDTRQTVVPPSVHPSGPTYAWLSGPVAPDALPLFGPDDLERFEDTLRSVGWDPDTRPPSGREVVAPPREVDHDDYWAATKAAALACLDDWVPALDLYGCKRARGGYEAVATWRGSSTGQPLEKRKRNLSIQSNGIKDFGTSETFSAIDLVMRAHGVDQAAATTWLREQLRIDEDGVVIDLQPVVKLQPVVVTSPRVEPCELPDALTRVPGLVGQVVDWIADSARRPQRGLALGAALAIVGTAAGRKYAGPTRTGTHLYVLGLARTGAGKDHPRDAITQALAGCGLTQHIGPSQCMSMSGLVNRVSRQPLTLTVTDEFADFLARINSKRGNPHEKAITGLMRTLWGASFKTVPMPEWADRAVEPLHAPAYSLYGLSTHEEFYAALAGGEVTNGFLNRFLLFSTMQRPRDRDPKVDGNKVPRHVKAGVQAVYGSGSALVMGSMHNGQSDGPLITAVWADADARQVYVDFGDLIEQREADSAFLARTVEIAQRLATIRAIGIDPATPRVTVVDMQWGRDVALWSAERMMLETSDYMAENETEAQSQRIVRTIRAAGGSMAAEALVRKLQAIRARDLKDLLENLKRGGLVVEERRVTGGRPATTYRLT